MNHQLGGARSMQASRLQKAGPYLFADLYRKQRELQEAGVDVINLALGDPDLPTPPHIVEALCAAARDPSNHRYPTVTGMRQFREAIAEWFHRRFGVRLDPETEVLTLIGSKEGLAHLALALVNPGEVALVPDPGYPVYRSSTILADGEPVPVPLPADFGFVPDLSAVPLSVCRRARILFLNYPNNPTGAVATLDFFRDVVRFAQTHGILVVHDNSYSEIAYDGYRPPSFLQVDGAKEVGVEFHSLSKTYSMAGWRTGFAVGNPAAIESLTALKTNLDAGIFQAIQYAAIAALRGPEAPVSEHLAIYQRRRDMLTEGLDAMGWNPPRVRASFYFWLRTPGGCPGTEFAADLLKRAGIVVTPGIGYGAQGEHYVRISITSPDDRLQQALDRLGRVFG